MVVWLIVWYMHANWPCSHWELHCFLTITTKNEKNGNRTGQSRYIGLVGLMKRKEKEVQNCSQRKPELSNFLILWSSKVWRKEFTHYSEWVIIIVSKFLRLPLDCWKLKFFYIASDFKWTFFQGGGALRKNWTTWFVQPLYLVQKDQQKFKTSEKPTLQGNSICVHTFLTPTQTMYSTFKKTFWRGKCKPLGTCWLWCEENNKQEW